MKRLKIKELLSRLSYEEQAAIILAFKQWMIIDYIVSIERGFEKMPADGLNSLRNLDPGLEDRLRDAVERGDGRSLKSGIMELIRILPTTQKQSNGPRINMFLSRRLPDRVFRLLYGAVGLDVELLRYDTSFPTDPML